MTTNRYPFLPEDSETAQLVRSIDWSKSPLGPVEAWSPTLKTTLGMLFWSRHPMFLWWGPELIQFYNDAYRPSFGRGRHPCAMGQRGQECWPEIWPSIGPQIREVMEHKRASWHENQLLPIFRNEQLEDVYWTYSYSPVVDPDGTVRGTLVVCNETTETVKSGKELARARAEADLARGELQGVFMQAPLPMCILTGPDHRFTLANGLYQELVGREVLGRTLREVFTVEEVGYYVPILDEVYRTGDPVVVREAPLRLPDAQGKIEDRFIDVGYHPYRDPNRKPQGILVVIHDVTAQVKARKAVEGLAAARAAEIRARDEFLSIASHELRTPLTGIKLHVQSAKRNLDRVHEATVDAAWVSKLIGQTDRGLLRMTHLVEDMLDVSRIQGGRLTLQRSREDLATVARETVSRYAAELATAEIPVTFVVDGDVPVDIDRARIEQVLTNLITNTIRYARGAPLRVTVARRGTQAHLDFEDRGPGIPAADRERVFERFQRLDTTRYASGLGIGLFIAREIVQAHGGRMFAEDRQGGGARLVVELPLAG